MAQTIDANKLELLLGRGEILKNTRHPARAKMDKKYIDDYLGRNVIDRGETELWVSAERRKATFGEKYIVYAWYVTTDKKSSYHFEVINPKGVYEMLKRLFEQRQ